MPRNTAAGSWALVLAMMAVLSAAAYAATATPAGYPHVDFQVTAPNYNSTDVASNIAAWLRANTALNKFGSQLNGTAIEVYDYVQVGNLHSMNFTVNVVGINNVDIYNALKLIVPALNGNGVLGSTLAYSSAGQAHLHENPPNTITYYLDPLSVVYQDQRSPVYTIRLSAAPRIGRNVTFHIVPTQGSVQFNTSKVVIPWPLMTGKFFARVGWVFGITCGVRFDQISGSDYAPGRYLDGPSANTEVITVRRRESISVSALSSSQRLYAGRTSPSYILRVPQHRDPSFSLVVTVLVTPSTGLTVSPQNVSITQPNVDATFTVSGVPGTYTISYLVGHPYVNTNGFTIGASNNDFQQITGTNQITVQPSMNASSASIPDAYLMAPVTSSDYGGAYSQAILFHIERDPIPGTFLTVTPSSSSNIDFYPASTIFFPGGARQFAFQYRAHDRGTHTINYALSSSAAGDYYLKHTSRRWIVRGTNPQCLTRSASSTCFNTPGCIWNEARGRCSNTTLPIAIDPIPLLYDNEQSIPLNFTLPTAIRGSLTVTFVGDSRLTFTPPSVTVVPNGRTGQFRITASLLSTDVGRVKANFQLRLTGTSANLYTEQRGDLFARPKIQCVVTAPPQAFFVKTVSAPFTITCPSDPEEEVIMTPTSTLSSVKFIVDNNNVSLPTDRIYFKPGQLTRQFYANSTSSQQGNAVLNIAISGVNAARYMPIVPASFRVIPSGIVNIPPKFHMTAYETSELLHIDLSTAPPTPLNLTIRPVNNDSSPADVNITVRPNVIIFTNTTQRGSFQVTAVGVGTYFLEFSISGANVANYIEPKERMVFEVKDPLSGRAFDARLRPGYLGHRRQCRVTIGRSSTQFRGQAPIERTEEFCQQHPTVTHLPNETYDCTQHVTQDRCRYALDKLGQACVWHNDACEFVPRMQGNILSYAYGSEFTAFLSLAGNVWTIGNTRYGQLGHYNTTIDKVPLPENIAAIAAGSNHMMALSYSGRVYTWGANQNGQLGRNLRTQQTEVAEEVPFPKGENITCISSGTLHLAALSQSGRLFTWGSNKYGQLGTRAQYRGYATGPVALGRDLFNGDAVVAVTLGEYHTMAATDNSAYTWGSNTMGQLGRTGYDEWEPKPPVLWVRDRWTAAPTYASYLLGRDNC